MWTTDDVKQIDRENDMHFLAFRKLVGSGIPNTSVRRPTITSPEICCHVLFSVQAQRKELKMEHGAVLTNDFARRGATKMTTINVRTVGRGKSAYADSRCTVGLELAKSMLDFQIGDSSGKIQTWLNQQTRLLATGLLEKPLRAVEWNSIFWCARSDFVLESGRRLWIGYNVHIYP